MDDGIDRNEDELQHRQDGRLYPVGRSLRSTFPAPDGEELQPRITALMVELAHQPFEPSAVRGGPDGVATAPQAPSMLRQIAHWLRSRA